MSLKAYLKAKGLNPTQFAAIAGLDVSVIHRLVTGQRKPTLETAFKVEDATGGKVKARSWIPK